MPVQPAATVRPIPKPEPVPSTSAAAPIGATTSGEILAVALADISAGWPEAVRREISRDGLEKAKCELPMADIGGPLKNGLVQFPWQQVRAWLKPAPTTAATPETAGTILDLPLRIIAPLYLAQSRAAQSQKKIAVDNEVPELFQKGQAQEAPRPPAAPTPRPRPVAAAPPAPPREAPAPAVAATPAVPAAASAGEGHLNFALALISGNWPEQVKKEIALHNLSNCKLEVPFQVIEQGLKQGRIEYRWRHICQWMKPPPPSGMTSANLETRLDYRLELPLNIVAPLFLQTRAKVQQKKAEPATDIPELFNAAGQVLAEAPPEEDDTPADTFQRAPAQPAPVPPAPAQPAPAWPAPAATSTPRKVPQNLAEMFGEPEKRHWTPNEIVNKTCQLPGVTGSLIALQDGLLVASCMPPSWTTETIAAFLPQIFGRMNQYTKELKMGELKSVSFNITASTLQIFNAGIIYFAALGRPDAPLPTDSLTIIADELSRHTK
jgi:predicted regulator of Ras-like GTPase activity (Roadblock/LC7/MglB family)